MYFVFTAQEWWMKTANYVMSRGINRLVESLDEETINYIHERLNERLALKNDKQFDAADEIRDELRERFGVSINDRMQEWTIEVDQFTVVDNTTKSIKSSRSPSPQPSYSTDGIDDNGDYENASNRLELDVDTGYSVPTGISIDLDFDDLTIPELKEKLRAAGLPVSGRKSELIERLSESSN